MVFIVFENAEISGVSNQNQVNRSGCPGLLPDLVICTHAAAQNHSTN